MQTSSGMLARNVGFGEQVLDVFDTRKLVLQA